ncbi:protein phosphatase 1 regulatory subunit 42-like [Onthophagus taurus]|uniref:protein phosphatase 1 regulatory subunit 42-like n=1 Tax=Onthophagus taurus TaxID=166361 RepID=UPI0039BE7374
MDKVKDKKTLIKNDKKGGKLKEEKNQKDKIEVFLKVTHLYWQDKCLKSIKNLNSFINLSVLYLHNNNIEKIENLNGLRYLVALYLQKNKIKKLENLHNLTRLERLYLGHNEIRVIENLENLISLTELHIEKQNLPKGSSLCLDPRSRVSLSNTLEMLNISDNNIQSIENLASLYYLKNLIASNNNITDIKKITNSLKHMVNLREADFLGNPVAKERKYRDKIISCTYLKCLDGKEVSKITRCFIKRLEEERNYANKSKAQLIDDGFEDNGKRYSLGMKKSVCNLMLKPVKSGINVTGEDDAEYLGWKSLPNSFKLKKPSKSCLKK